jgi:hypothetical protein
VGDATTGCVGAKIEAAGVVAGCVGAKTPALAADAAA